MKCPRCEYSYSSNRDVCPRCGLDVPQWAARRGRERHQKRSERRASGQSHRGLKAGAENRRSLASEKRDSLKQDVSDLVDGLKQLEQKNRLRIKNTSQAGDDRTVISNPNSYEAIKAEWDRLDEDVTADQPDKTVGVDAPLDISFDDLLVEAPTKNILADSASQPKVSRIELTKDDEEEVSYLDLHSGKKSIRDRVSSGTRKSVKESKAKPLDVPEGKSLEELTQVIERVADKKSGKGRSKKQQAEFDKLSKVFTTTNSDSSSEHPVVLPEDV